MNAPASQRPPGLSVRVVNKVRQLGASVVAATGRQAGHWTDRLCSAWDGPRKRRRAGETFRREQAAASKRFSDSDETLTLPGAEAPTLSVALTLGGEAAANLAALRGLVNLGGELSPAESMEVFLIGTLTAAWRPRVRGAVESLRTEPGVYLRFAERAKGECLLLLGGGCLPGGEAGPTESAADGARSALGELRHDPNVGAVTGRIVDADGSLHSAGIIVPLGGGLTEDYGRGLPAASPEAMFAREVDGGSADALIVSRERFLALGGFGAVDDPNVPGNARGVEWGRRVIQSGGRVCYEPALVYRRAAGGNDSRFVRNARTGGAGNLSKRDRRKTRARVLLVEDRVPYPWLGAGFPRSAELLAALVRMGCAVTLYPMLQGPEDWREVYGTVDRRVEVMVGYDALDFPRFWRERVGFYDLCIISRPHNMARLRGILLSGGVPVVYDAEALYCLRGLTRRQMLGLPTPPDMERRRISREVRLARGSAAVLSVSEQESARFREHLAGEAHPPRFYVLRHTVPIAPTAAGFHDRRGLLFVGSLHDPSSPNADSVDWFLREVFPRFREAAAAGGQVLPPPFLLAGSNPAGLDFSGLPGVESLGRVEDLSPVYNRARVFVAPTRYAAGVPLKVYEAAGRGVPVVATPLLGGQLGWRAGEEFLEAGDPETFAGACRRLHEDSALWLRLRENALRRVAAECSAQGFRAAVERIVTENVGPTRVARL